MAFDPFFYVASDKIDLDPVGDLHIGDLLSQAQEPGTTGPRIAELAAEILRRKDNGCICKAEAVLGCPTCGYGSDTTSDILAATAALETSR